MITFTWTISLGNVVTLGVVIVGLFASHAKNLNRLQEIETKTNAMYRWFEMEILANRGGKRQ